MKRQVRFARPVSDLERAAAMYVQGLGLQRLGEFHDHDGFDGVMLGEPGHDCHFEFTFDRAGPVRPTPTREDLVVFYVPEPNEWSQRCDAMLAAGFAEIEPHNPYWKQRGRSFRDEDGYIVVIERAVWNR